MRSRPLIQLFVALVLGGCTTMIRVQDAPSERPIRVSTSLPIALQPPVFALEPGTVVGGHSANPERAYHLLHTWMETFEVDRMEFNFALRDELTSHGYRFAVGSAAQYRLESRITHVVYNLFGNDSRVGWTEAEVTVEWVLRGPKTITVVTRGSATTRPHSLASLFNAYRASLRNFLARQDVADIVAPGGGAAVAQPAPSPAVRPVAPPLQPQPTIAQPRPQPAPQPQRPPPTIAPPVQVTQANPPPSPPTPAPATPATPARVIPRPAGSGAPLGDAAQLQRSRVGVVTVLAGDGWQSGVVLTHGGLIVTAAQSVTGSPAITVVTHDGKEHSAQLLASDTTLDLALLQVSGAGFTPIAFELQPPTSGQPVLTVGTPFHPALSFSESRGKVTGSRERQILTDVRVSAGNAGGPVVDALGRAIGVVTWPAGRSTPSAKASCVAAAVVFSALGLAYTN